MNWFNRIKSTSRQAASNLLSGARLLASAVVPESIQRRFNNFCDWLTDYVEPKQIPQGLIEILEHVRENYPPSPPSQPSIPPRPT